MSVFVHIVGAVQVMMPWCRVFQVHVFFSCFKTLHVVWYVHAIIDPHPNTRKPAMGLRNSSSRGAIRMASIFEVQQVLEDSTVVVLLRYLHPDPSNRFPSLPNAE